MATKTAAREVDPNPGDLDDIIDNIPGQTIPFPARTVLDDITDAVDAYPTTYVTLTIVDIDKDGDYVNTGEEVRFHVKVTNNGPMTMKDVRLKAVAKNGTEVKSGGVARGVRGGRSLVQHDRNPQRPRRPRTRPRAVHPRGAEWHQARRHGAGRGDGRGVRPALGPHSHRTQRSDDDAEGDVRVERALDD